MEELVCGSSSSLLCWSISQSFPSAETSFCRNENEKLNLSNGLCPVCLSEHGFNFSLWWDMIHPRVDIYVSFISYLFLRHCDWIVNKADWIILEKNWIWHACTGKYSTLFRDQNPQHHIWLLLPQCVQSDLSNVLKYSHSCIHHTSVHCVLVNNVVFGCRACVFN